MLGLCYYIFWDLKYEWKDIIKIIIKVLNMINFLGLLRGIRLIFVFFEFVY